MILYLLRLILFSNLYTSYYDASGLHFLNRLEHLG
jgi:hypothetical protein